MLRFRPTPISNCILTPLSSLVNTKKAAFQRPFGRSAVQDEDEPPFWGRWLALPDKANHRCGSGGLPFQMPQEKATFVERRRKATPTMPKPAIISAQLAGSGTGSAAKVAVPE